MAGVIDRIESARGRVMFGQYLPAPIYWRSQVMAALMGTEGAEFDALRATVDEIRDQFYVGTATWALSLWESELGLETIAGASVQYRRERIIALLRGWGTATPKKVKQVAETFTHGHVDITEDFSTYKVTLTFTGATAIPENVSQFYLLMRRLIPAHLAIEYVFLFTTWDAHDALRLTWDAWDALGLTWDTMGSAPGEVVPPPPPPPPPPGTGTLIVTTTDAGLEI